MIWLLLLPHLFLPRILHKHSLHNQDLLDGRVTLNWDELLVKALANLLTMDGVHLKIRRKKNDFKLMMNTKKDACFPRSLPEIYLKVKCACLPAFASKKEKNEVY